MSTSSSCRSPIESTWLRWRRRFLTSGLLLLLAGRATAALTVSPATVSNSFNGTITLNITGVSSGQRVIVEKFFDADNSNSINAGDIPLLRVKVTDGQVTNLAGRRNLNVPGDEDGAVNSAIQTKLYFSPEELPGRLEGRHIFRITQDSGAAFTFTGTLMVTQQDYSGSGISGRVMAGAVAQAGAIVLIAAGTPEGDWDVAGVARTNATGNFSMKVPAKSYFLIAAKSGFIFNIAAAPRTTVPAGSFAASADAVLTTRARTIAGAVRDDSAAHAPVTGALVFSQTQAGLFSFSFSDAAGNYVLDAAAGALELGVGVVGPLALQGLVRQAGFSDASAGNVTGFNLDMPRATALIYGTVRTQAGTAVPFIDVRGEPDSDTEYEAGGITDATGNYTLGVVPENWDVEGQSPLYLFSQEQVIVGAAGVAVLKDLTAHTVTTHLRGIARDNSNIPVPNLAIIARADDNTTVNATTAANGSFDFGIYGGTVANPKNWWIQLNQDDNGGPANYVGTYPNFEVTDGTDINGITFLVYTVTAHLRGTVLDENNAPFSNGNNISANLQSGNAWSDSDVAGDGSFDIGVFNGTWSLGMSHDFGSGVLAQQPFEVSVNNADQNNLIYRVRHTTGTISGTLKNPQGGGLAGILISADASLGGAAFHNTTLTDAGGNFSMPVFAATWTVQPTSFGPEGLENLGYEPVASANVTTGPGNSIINFVAHPPDNTPPSLSSSLPVNNATGVAVSSTISFTFSEPMQTGYSIAWTPSVNENQFSFAWSGDQRTLTCTYGANLPSGSTIGWTLNPSTAGQSFRDLADNPLPQNISGSFTTAGPPPDTTPPTLASSVPANNATGVALNSTVSFTFSEPMQSGVSMSWSPNVTANQFSTSWSGDGRTLTRTYNTSLPSGVTISWTLNPSGFGQNFRDVAGNALASNISGSFTTAAAPGPGWSYKPFMPTARTGSRAATINGLLYVVGGFNNSGNLLNALEVYNPNQGTWQSLAPMPTARHSAGVGVIGGKLYVAGGLGGGTVLEVYDPATNTWATRQPMHINHGGAAGVIGDKLYVVGPSTNFTISLEEYDPATNVWTIRTPMPNPRAAGAAVLNGLLYTVGGDSLGTVEAYDPATDNWTPKAALPGNGNSIYNPGVAVMEGKLYVAGGFNHGTTVHIYDPTAIQWSQGPPMLIARGDLAVAALPDKLFAVGGVDAPGQTTLPFMEQLTLSASDRVVTTVLRSDTSTLAAALGSGVPSAAMLNRLNAGDTAGLTFQPALAGAFGASTIDLPTGSPAGTQIVNIPAGNGQSGFFRLSFVLPPGYAGAQISCGATMDYYGRAFLNGNALTPAIDAAQQFPAPGTIRSELNQDVFFSSKNAAHFREGTNYVDFADINANGGASAGAFFALATFVVNPPLPPLRITQAGANVILTWPAADVGWTLQSAPSLAPPVVWGPVVPAPVILGGLHTVTTPVTGTRKFFRLSQ